MNEKVVVITGAAGGIGSATARRFSDAGARLVLSDVDIDRLEGLTAQLSPEPLRVKCDVAKLDDIKHLLAETLSRMGRIDILINNAGIIRPNKLEDLSYPDISAQIDVNLLSVIFASKEVLPIMKAQGGGHIVNICSLGGIVPEPGSSVYSATKFGVRGFSLTLAMEVKRYGINVSIVCPDSVDTPMLEYEAKCGVSGVAFANKPLSPDDVALAIMHAVKKKRLEVYVPYSEGLMAKIALTMPWIYRYVLPILEKKGQKNLLKRGIK
ncbi:MAG: SDR family oxidoreductase [Deltaproteobacteria bacterium]|nr:SDR family oxidoreductase [Deltaproteobacteria bacterium]